MLSIRICAAFYLMATTTLLAAQQETCYRINPDSPVDQKFLEKLSASGIFYRKDKPDVICVPASTRSSTSALRDAVHNEFPQDCVSLDEKQKYSILEEQLRAESLPHWMEKPEGPLCYFRSDSLRVRQVITRVFKGGV